MGGSGRVYAAWRAMGGGDCACDGNALSHLTYIHCILFKKNSFIIVSKDEPCKVAFVSCQAAFVISSACAFRFTAAYNKTPQ